jgi:hypothetical protein
MAIGAFRVVAPITQRGLVVVGDKNRPRHPPVANDGLLANLGLAFGVVGPVRFQMLWQKEVRR